MLDFNYGYIILAIATLGVAIELFITVNNTEKGKYIYGELQHSLEHISYLSIYLFGLLIYFAMLFFKVDSAYFEIMIGTATLILTWHLSKERKHN